MYIPKVYSHGCQQMSHPDKSMPVLGSVYFEELTDSLYCVQYTYLIFSLY